MIEVLTIGDRITLRRVGAVEEFELFPEEMDELVTDLIAAQDELLDAMEETEDDLDG